jgi:hypothetical protein
MNFSMHIDDNLHEALRKYCFEHRLTMSRVIKATMMSLVHDRLEPEARENIETWLRREPGRPPEAESATAQNRRERLARVEASNKLKEQQAKEAADAERYLAATTYQDEPSESEGPEEWAEWKKLRDERNKEGG